MDDRNSRRTAAAAHAGQNDADVAKALGNEMAETMPPDKLVRLAYPEISLSAPSEDDAPAERKG
jgi:hypothetical protein